MGTSESELELEDIPNLIRNRPLLIHDMAMSKFHTAILTTDEVSNLYVCGVGRGGRLGLGDENTQFKFQPVQGPLAGKKIHQVALGQNHTIVVAGNGELWSWGLNSDSQLGYVLPPTLQADEEPMALFPRQVFGSLKKEIIHGIAASAVHSVAHTGQSLYCWGRNLGQLALMDADSRSLDVQQTPRKVAASLLSSPIALVSAIDKATTCLLTNGTVVVFTNYGYNLVRFPTPDAYANQSLAHWFFSSELADQNERKIRHVVSGGETIAAVTARGDLFTMHIRDKEPRQQGGGSTTNPVKIKDALTKPQCVWDSKKDGVVSVSVGENGSVIICTHSGAVWRRVKRTKGKKPAISVAADAKRKDFKFERVPYITDCVKVRSSTYGAICAVRRGSKVMSHQMKVGKQSLWDDVASLSSLKGFRASECEDVGKGHRKQWIKAIQRETPGSLPHEILRSADLETDLIRWLKIHAMPDAGADILMRTTASPDICIPVHSWVLSARSPVLRDALVEFRQRGTFDSSDSFTVESVESHVFLTILNVDVFTLLNVATCSYEDVIIPVWKYARDDANLAFRFRQVRTEVMKIATKLQMPKLEAAARLQASLELSLDADLRKAVADPKFFDDSDVVIQLDGQDFLAHSQMLCKRCPYFAAMFHGRSGGQWLAGRRDELGSGQNVSIDLRHVSPETFQYVFLFIYSDAGEEMFNDVAKSTIDEFSELVLDVMSVANELLLDRLSQVCQSVIGKFVTTRNIGNLLNEISLCVVTEFKDAGLEYICLQLESMLENHLLDGLGDDLLEELNGVVRDNQLCQSPVARSGRAEAQLLEKYPELLVDIEEERQRHIKEMASRASLLDDRKTSSSYKIRFGSFDEADTAISLPEATPSKLRNNRIEPSSPSSLHRKVSQADMIFEMEQDDGSLTSSVACSGLQRASSREDFNMEGVARLPQSWRDSKGKGRAGIDKGWASSPPLPPSASPGTGRDAAGLPASRTGSPWAAAPLPTARLDLRDIMSETSSESALTAGLTAQQRIESRPAKSQPRTSQKERKKQLQQQSEARAAAQGPVARRDASEHGLWASRAGPWKMAAAGPDRTGTPVSDASSKGTLAAGAKPLVAAEAGVMAAQRRTASPDTRFPGQGRLASLPAVPACGPQQREQKRLPVMPHSKSYIEPAPKQQPVVGASMADIIGQQRREQELVKEAVAKRSLEEIQQEQAFQEWWDQESRRAQEEEARRQNRGPAKDVKAPRRGRRGRGGKGGASGDGEKNGGVGRRGGGGDGPR